MHSQKKKRRHARLNTCQYVHAHTEDMYTLHILTYTSAYRHKYVLKSCSGAIGKVRPTLTVLCCCQPSRHVFKEVFFPRCLTYAGQQPHRHSSICYQASVNAL